MLLALGVIKMISKESLSLKEQRIAFYEEYGLVLSIQDLITFNEMEVGI